MAKKSTVRAAKTSKKKSKTVKKSTKKSGSTGKVGTGKTGGGSSGVGIQSQHVDFLSYKIEQVRRFYEDSLELKTQTRDADGLNYLVVRTSSSSTIGFMPPHPDMSGDQPLPREPTLYFLVKDLDAVYAHLVAKGVPFMGPPEEMPWGHRVITTTDPEGRTVMLASAKTKAKRSTS